MTILKTPDWSIGVGSAAPYYGPSRWFIQIGRRVLLIG